MRLGARARGGRDAGRDHLLARRRSRPARTRRTPAERRNLVLPEDDRAGRTSPRRSTRRRRDRRSPLRRDIEKPEEDSLSPYFTSWLRQQLVDRYGAGRRSAAASTSTRRSTSTCRRRPSRSPTTRLAGIEPTASVVVIDNETGARQGDGRRQRLREGALQPRDQRPAPAGLLVQAVHPAHGLPERRFGPGNTFTSEPQRVPVPNSGGKEVFKVENYDDIYYGTSDVATATKYSDNSIFAELGLGPPAWARRAPRRSARRPSDGNRRRQLRHQPGHDPRRYRPRRDAARDGLRLQHDRARRPAHRRRARLDPGPNEDLEDLGPVAIREVVKPDGRPSTAARTRT